VDSFTVFKLRYDGAGQRVTLFARQPDDGKPPPGFTTLDRLEQVSVRRIGQLQVNRERGVQVGQHRPVHRYTVVAFRLEVFEYFPVHGHSIVGVEKSDSSKA
jgi:hypothetical protein